MAHRKHSFKPENVSVVQQEPLWFRRGVAESVYIAITEQDLNRDCGWHTLPPIHKELPQSRDLPPTVESHDHTNELVELADEGEQMSIQSSKLLPTLFKSSYTSKMSTPQELKPPQDLHCGFASGTGGRS